MNELITPKALTPHQQFVEQFKAHYQKKTGNPYKVDKVDFILTARLIKEFGLDCLVQKTEILSRHCERQSAWFTRNGWADFTIGKLSKFFNELIPEKSSQTDWAKEFREKENSDILI